MSARTFILASALLLFTSTSPAQSLKPYGPPNSGYTVKMPIKPEHIVKKKKTAIGEIQTDVMEADHDEVRYRATFTELPKFAARFAGCKKIVANAKGGILNDVFAKEVSFTDVERWGFPGKRLEYRTADTDELDPLIGVAEIYCDGRYLTVLNVTTLQGKKVPLEFFDSVWVAPEFRQPSK